MDTFFVARPPAGFAVERCAPPAGAGDGQAPSSWGAQCKRESCRSRAGSELRDERCTPKLASAPGGALPLPSTWVAAGGGAAASPPPPATWAATSTRAGKQAVISALRTSPIHHAHRWPGKAQTPAPVPLQPSHLPTPPLRHHAQPLPTCEMPLSMFVFCVRSSSSASMRCSAPASSASRLASTCSLPCTGRRRRGRWRWAGSSRLTVAHGARVLAERRASSSACRLTHTERLAELRVLRLCSRQLLLAPAQAVIQAVQPAAGAAAGATGRRRQQQQKRGLEHRPLAVFHASLCNR